MNNVNIEFEMNFFSIPPCMLSSAVHVCIFNVHSPKGINLVAIPRGPQPSMCVMRIQQFCHGNHSVENCVSNVVVN